MSFTDLDDKAVRGGRFFRITPLLNWYASRHLRLMAAYGFGVLDRFDAIGVTHVFDGRIALTF